MATGLCLLGRGEKRRLYALVHVISASLGGALVGLTVGTIGLQLTTAPRLAVVATGIAFAAYLAIRPLVKGNGLRRQVPRGLGKRLHPLLGYAVWGAELGGGLSTLIPYSAFLLLISFEMSSGRLVGAAAGAAFGFARQGTAVLVAGYGRSPGQIMSMLPRLASQARVTNLIVCLLGSTALMVELAR
jgi:hypothetical protein